MSSPREPSGPHKRRLQKLTNLSKLTVAGLVLVLVGLGCLGYVGYQLVGTNVVADRAFTTEKDQLRSRWEQPPQSSTPAKGTTSARPTPPGDQSAVPGDAMALLRIPEFGSSYEVPILAGTDLRTLARGVGHYTNTAKPGQVGNFAIAGHRITHGQPFSRLLELERGDQVIVETRTSVFTYVIDEPPKALTVKASAGWVLDPVPGKPTAKPRRALMTLTTCQDLFHSDDRSIGFAHLASTKNKG